MNPNVSFFPIKLDNLPADDADLLRFRRAVEGPEMKVRIARRFGTLWQLYIHGHNVFLDKDNKTASCDCIDFNPRQRSKGKPCKHIYKGLLHLAANCAAEDVLVYAQEKLSQKMPKGRK